MPRHQSAPALHEAGRAVDGAASGRAGTPVVVARFTAQELGVDFDPWPVVAGVRAGTQAASQPQLVPGLVLAAVQGQPVEGVGMDVARNMLMEAGRPVRLTFVHSAGGGGGGGSSLRTSMTETWDGWKSWLGGGGPAPSPAAEPAATNDGGAQQRQQQWQTVTPAQLQQGSETLEGVDSPSMRAVAKAMLGGVDGADGDGDGLGELERELVREALPLLRPSGGGGGGGSAVLSPWQVGQLHAALPCSERFSTWRRCYSTAVHGSSLNTFFRKVRAGAAASRQAGGQASPPRHLAHRPSSTPSSAASQPARRHHRHHRHYHHRRHRPRHHTHVSACERDDERPSHACPLLSAAMISMCPVISASAGGGAPSRVPQPGGAGGGGGVAGGRAGRGR
jgi:hypothetical protein